MMLIQHCLKKVIIVWYDSHKEHHTLSLLQNTTSLAAVSTRKQCDCAVLIFSYINPRKRIIPVRNYRFITLSTELYEELITMICGLKQHGAAGKKMGILFCSTGYGWQTSHLGSPFHYITLLQLHPSLLECSTVPIKKRQSKLALYHLFCTTVEQYQKRLL